jgi:rare lipoprotein A
VLNFIVFIRRSFLVSTPLKHSLFNTSFLSISVLIFLLQACGTTSRYQQSKDTIPSRKPVAEELVNAIPRAEAHSRGGNKNYRVLGKDYQVLKSAKNFTEEGIASFYGEKFHGHLTSNGEIYDMYAMTAAHKNLPLPTYVKVTNLNNQKTVIVRVNDRGPFHQGRIIDLSYSAAYKLGINGTAPVKISAITDFSNVEIITKKNNIVTTKADTIVPIDIPLNINKTKKIGESKAANNLLHFIDVYKTTDIELAKKLVKAFNALYQQPTSYENKDGFYTVLLGPVATTQRRNEILNSLKRSGYNSAYNKERRQP